MSKHVIYNNKVWNIATQTEKDGSYMLKLDNGTVIKVSKFNNNLRSITIGNEKPVSCTPITTTALPDYPTKDQRNGFVDNNYQIGDSAILIGWMKDMPQDGWNYGREFGVGIFSKNKNNQMIWFFRSFVVPLHPMVCHDDEMTLGSGSFSGISQQLPKRW